MNSLTGKKGFLFFFYFMINSFCSYLASCLISRAEFFTYSTDYGGRLLVAVCILKASGSFDDAFLAIFGLAMCGS